jgi:ribonuclease-3
LSVHRPELEDEAADFGAAVGYAFRDSALAELALSHPSYSHDEDGTRGNERLEFLGDAVLDLVVADLLFHAHPDWTEGDLTRSRAALVNQRYLADVARDLGVDRFVKLGRTERRTAGDRKDSVLANCLEAIIGAIYLDSGFAGVTAWVAETFAEGVAGGGAPERRDAKTMFQEWAHARFRTTPSYRTVRDSGTDNDEERFSVEVLIGADVWGRGVGRSKRVAERRAAGAALARGAESDA